MASSCYCPSTERVMKSVYNSCGVRSQYCHSRNVAFSSVWSQFEQKVGRRFEKCLFLVAAGAMPLDRKQNFTKASRVGLKAPTTFQLTTPGGVRTVWRWRGQPQQMHRQRSQHVTRGCCCSFCVTNPTCVGSKNNMQ